MLSCRTLCVHTCIGDWAFKKQVTSHSGGTWTCFLLFWQHSNLHAHHPEAGGEEAPRRTPAFYEIFQFSCFCLSLDKNQEEDASPITSLFLEPYITSILPARSPPSGGPAGDELMLCCWREKVSGVSVYATVISLVPITMSGSSCELKDAAIIIIILLRT